MILSRVWTIEFLEFDKLLNRESGLFDNFAQQSASDSFAAVNWNRSYAPRNRMPKKVVATLCVYKTKTGMS